MMTISSLPPEILVHIFLLYHASTIPHELGLTFCKPDTSTSPLLLTHVCSHWRDIGLSISQFWSSLRLDWDVDNLVKNAEICETWLGRSEHSPLSLSFTDRLYHFWGENESDDGSVSEAIMKAILPFKNRWKCLFLTLNRKTSLPSLALLFQPPHCPPTLETLALNGISQGSSECISLGDVSTLRRLSIGHACAIPSLGNFPWGQLTHLTSTSEWDPHAALEILHECRSLKDLKLCLEVVETDEMDRTLSLPHLERFCLDARRNQACPFLDTLTLPRLNQFWYKHTGGGSTDASFQTVSALLKRSGHPLLEHLWMWFWTANVDEAHLLELLETAPNLIELDIKVNWPTSSSAKPYWQGGFTRQLGKSSLGRCLKSLGLLVPGCMDEGSLKALILDRDDLAEISLELERVSDEFREFLDKVSDRVKFSVRVY